MSQMICVSGPPEVRPQSSNKMTYPRNSFVSDGIFELDLRSQEKLAREGLKIIRLQFLLQIKGIFGNSYVDDDIWMLVTEIRCWRHFLILVHDAYVKIHYMCINHRRLGGRPISSPTSASNIYVTDYLLTFPKPIFVREEIDFAIYSRLSCFTTSTSM